jgi:hypothetical protein
MLVVQDKWEMASKKSWHRFNPRRQRFHVARLTNPLQELWCENRSVGTAANGRKGNSNRVLRRSCWIEVSILAAEVCI